MPKDDEVLQSADSSFMSTACNFDTADAASVQLEVELTDEAGHIAVETRTVPADQVAQAQRIIAGAARASKVEQNKAIEEAIQLVYPYAPREGQRDALWQLIYKRKDLILIAKTSFGKSMILQAASLLIRKSITVVVLPLNQVGLEQAEYITRIGGKPCFLNAETISAKVLTDIQNGKYTHVLISPELAIGDKFHTMAINPVFKERLGLVVVDEAHLVSQWGRGFRTEYARLGQLRSLFGSHAPWFACSATLDAEALKELKKGVGFEDDVTIMRTSIDRPELVIRTGWIPTRSRQNASALRFLFDEGVRTNAESTPMPQQIPKTIVFFDSKKEAYAAMQECRNWLQESGKHKYSKKQARETIKVFHRNTAKSDKEAIIAEFRRLAKGSSIRVIFATEALGLGVNLPDARRVILYGLPKGEDPAIMWQRGGRASRDGQDGEIILLTDDWVKGPRTRPQSIQKDCRSNRRSNQNSQPLDEAILAEVQNESRKLTLPERRGNLSNFWYALTNEPGCLRARFLDHFDEPQELRTHIRKDRCCSNCNPDRQLGKLDNHYLYSERGNGLNARRKKVLELVTTWAENQVSAAFPNPSFRPVVDCFISADQLTQLAKDAHLITNLDELHKALGSWGFFQAHGAELLANLRTAHHAAGEAITQASGSRTQTSSQSSQGGDIWVPVITQLSTSQPTSLQTIPLPPPPAHVVTTHPASTQPVVPTRRPLGVVSGNAPRAKKFKRDTAHMEAPEPVAPRELPVSSFGRVRKASRRLIEH
jgi:superfamily II DNA helicase RecQ